MKQLTQFFILVLVLTSCVQESENNALGGYIDEEDYQNEFMEDIIVEDTVTMEVDTLATDTSFIDFTNNVLDLLDNNNLSELANQFHPEKGCRFVPYTFMDDENQVFSTSEFQDEITHNQVLRWGEFDGSGEPIDYTIKDYFKRFVYDVNYKDKASDIHINENLAFSNTLNNIEEFYPDAQYIELYYEGSTEYEGMDWSSLILYIETFEEKYYLVGIVHNQWTI